MYKLEMIFKTFKFNQIFENSKDAIDKVKELENDFGECELWQIEILNESGSNAN